MTEPYKTLLARSRRGLHHLIRTQQTYTLCGQHIRYNWDIVPKTDNLPICRRCQPGDED